MKKQLNLLKKKLELTAIAVTYAEVGEWGIAEDYLEKIEQLNSSKNPKIVVVAVDSEISAETAEYTVNLAERMHYDLLAVDAIQPARSAKLFGSSHGDDVGDKAKRIFNSLVEKAQASKIRFETIIAVSDFRSQIRQLLKLIRRVELVFIQVEKGKKLSLNLNVPVYQIEAG
jgi:hypothetical protein